MQNTAVEAMNRIKGTGPPTRAELLIMLPTLQQMQAAAEQYGFALDPTIAKYIEMAKKQKIWKDEDPAPTLEQSMVKLVDVLERLNTMLGTLTGSAAAFGNEMDSALQDREVVVTTVYETEGEPPPGMGKFSSDQTRHSGQPAYQGLRRPVRFTSRQMVQVDQGEVLTPDSFYASGAPISNAPHQNITLNVNVNVSALDFSEVGALAEQITAITQHKLETRELTVDTSPDKF